MAAGWSGGAPRGLVLRGAVLFAVLFAVFHLSPHVTVTDSRFSLLASEVLLTKGTLTLDGLVPVPDYRIYGRGGHDRLYFPEAGSVLAVPFMALMRPWGGTVFDGDGRFEEGRENALQKLLASLLCAAAGVVLWRLAAQFTGETAAMVIAIAACLASPVWGSASRALWADTWGFFLLSIALLLAVKPLRLFGLVVLGTCLSWMYFVKPTYSVPIAAITAVIIWRQGLRAWPLLATGAVWLAAFVFWSLHSHGTLQPGYFLVSRLREADVWQSLAPHIVSPSRGLLVYFPAAVWAIGMVVFSWKRLSRRDLALAAFAVITVHHVVHAAHSATAGHSYGARFGAPLVPWFVLLAAMGWAALPQAADRARRFALGCGGILVLWGALVNGRGAIDSDTWKWNITPKSIDESPERLWDWRRPQFLAGLLPEPLTLPEDVLLIPREIDFRGTDAAPFLVGGWGHRETEGRWSTGAKAGVAFSAEPGRGFLVRLTGRTLGPQRVVCLLNGERLANLRTDGDTWFNETVTLPGKLVRDRNLLEFRFPDRRAPHPSRQDGDRRELGLMVGRLEFLPRE